ncbi:hypothetical protein [Novosphingobium sp. HII-3]|uniref:hypothetical protein n=1 Tax=Novosphingobium sp. HII-3 TaxID=2075565 RepID=UPI000CDA7D43|nr:hypothetical protein [Novosphingobium sp. HII-3]
MTVLLLKPHQRQDGSDVSRILPPRNEPGMESERYPAGTCKERCSSQIAQPKRDWFVQGAVS